jgi:hypothetical protein
MTKTGEFSLLFDLAEQSAEEIGGRAATAVSPELQNRLANMAAGRCDEKERRELLSLLEQQPNLIPTLVKEIKNLRTLGKAPGEGNHK